jgi:hypothetical protein
MKAQVLQPYYAPVTIDVPDSWLGVSERRKRIKELEVEARTDKVAQGQLERAEDELRQLTEQAAFHLWRRDCWLKN